MAPNIGWISDRSEDAQKADDDRSRAEHKAVIRILIRKISAASDRECAETNCPHAYKGE